MLFSAVADRRYPSLKIWDLHRVNVVTFDAAKFATACLNNH